MSATLEATLKDRAHDTLEEKEGFETEEVSPSSVVKWKHFIGGRLKTTRKREI